MNYSYFLSECLSKNYVNMRKLVQTNPEYLDYRDERLGLSPLLHAVLLNDRSLVTYLLNLGADPNLTSSTGDSPLLEACSSGEFSIAKTLLEYGADVNATNSEGETAIQQAVFRAHPQLLQLLLDSGGNPNIMNLNTGDSPLHTAVHNSDLDCIQILLKNGANPTCLSKDRISPFDIAQAKGLGYLFDKPTVLHTISEEEDTPKRNILESFTFHTPCESDREIEELMEEWGLQECTEFIKKLGSLEDIIRIMKSKDPLSIERLKALGIKKIGTCVTLLVKLDCLAGNIHENKNCYMVNETFWCSVRCCSRTVVTKSFVTSIEAWLDIIGLKAETPKFKLAGYKELEVLYIQMNTRYPLTDAILQEIGILEEEKRIKILNSFERESRLPVGTSAGSVNLFSCKIF